MSHNDKPITCITVLCDPKRVHRIALTCRCTRRWTELIPAEVHDSQLICQFTCPACGQHYILRDHQFIKEDEFNAGRQVNTAPVGKFQFDA